MKQTYLRINSELKAYTSKRFEFSREPAKSPAPEETELVRRITERGPSVISAQFVCQVPKEKMIKVVPRKTLSVKKLRKMYFQAGQLDDRSKPHFEKLQTSYEKLMASQRPSPRYQAPVPPAPKSPTPQPDFLTRPVIPRRFFSPIYSQLLSQEDIRAQPQVYDVRKIGIRGESLKLESRTASSMRKSMAMWSDRSVDRRRPWSGLSRKTSQVGKQLARPQTAARPRTAIRPMTAKGA